MRCSLMFAESWFFIRLFVCRLRKNLKGFYVVHPTWYIKALITIIKPFIRSAASSLSLFCYWDKHLNILTPLFRLHLFLLLSSKFSRKLQFVDSLQELSQFIPTEHVQIPDSVREWVTFIHSKEPHRKQSKQVFCFYWINTPREHIHHRYFSYIESGINQRTLKMIKRWL